MRKTTKPAKPVTVPNDDGCGDISREERLLRDFFQGLNRELDAEEAEAKAARSPEEEQFLRDAQLEGVPYRNLIERDPYDRESDQELDAEAERLAAVHRSKSEGLN